MATLRRRLKSLFSFSAGRKNRRRAPTREEKGKARATDPVRPPRPPASAPSSVPDNDSYTDNDDYDDDDHHYDHENNTEPRTLLPIIHYSDLRAVPETLTRFHAFYLTGAPLPPPPLPQARQLLTSPADVKRTLVHPRGSTVRGYNRAAGSGREWWDYSPENDGRDLTLPDEAFQVSTRNFFDSSIAVLQRICAEFTTPSGTPAVPEKVLTSAGFSTMRYLRYSPEVFPWDSSVSAPGAATTSCSCSCSSSSSSSSSSSGASASPRRHATGRDVDPSTLPRMEAHTDHGVLTLMAATEPSGLYIWDRRGRIYSAPPVDGAVLIIAGDLMAHFTALEGRDILAGDGGVAAMAVGERTVLPTVHAVVVPSGVAERYSVAVFLRPRREMVLGRGVGGEEMTFGRWAEEKGRVRGRRCWMLGQGGA
ncbi:hypothetical protein DRE_04621 [Drechslerella stenobrocha 248]|uniref:Fe2OG dioxygenase domain-containing protein n=1 Tax=Drechslerella stenobrocha 248 TaxID=1043628 RepID=W7I0P3_9PEZI|nr:hypothetical protein DRE_04621 [Drechslerella stenobrocha 248]